VRVHGPRGGPVRNRQEALARLPLQSAVPVTACQFTEKPVDAVSALFEPATIVARRAY
jgi:hypothetical protein